LDWDFGRCDADSWAKSALPLKCVMCMTTLGNRPGSCFSATADIASTHAELLQLLFGGPLRVAPGALLVVYAPRPTGPPPTPCPRNAPALPPLTPTDAPPRESVRSFSAHCFALPRISRTGCPRPPAAPPHDTQATLVLVKRVLCPWIHRHRVFRIASGQPKNPWKESAEPSPHFVLVKQGCAPWPSFTAIGPSMIHLLSFQEGSHGHR